MFEFIMTEAAYVRDLQLIVEVSLHSQDSGWLKFRKTVL